MCNVDEEVPGFFSHENIELNLLGHLLCFVMTSVVLGMMYFNYGSLETVSLVIDGILGFATLVYLAIWFITRE